MKKEDVIDGTPTFTPQEIIERMILLLEDTIEDLKREQIILEGKISAHQSSLTNIKTWVNHRR